MAGWIRAIETWPFVGRREELAVIRAALGTAASPGAAVLAGVAGVGKSRLAREVLAAMQAEGADVVWAGATVSSAAAPFGAIRHVVPAAADSGTGAVALQTAIETLAER